MKRKRLSSKRPGPVAAKDSLVKDLKVDGAVADRFLKRWRELNDEYETKYMRAGKKWDYK
jgi:hypothetical protein